MKLVLTTSLLALAASGPAFGAAIVFSGSGADSAAIAPIRDAFRAQIGGGTVAGANGSFGGVRREINWDGVPDTFAAPNNLPAGFFNVNSPRGVIFSTPGAGFQVSANAGVAPVNFGNVDPSYSAVFAPFSVQRLFTPLGSNITDVNFFVAGTSTPATVSAFGAIFSDADLANTTAIQFFDGSGSALGSFFAPSAPGDQSLSFLGVAFNAGERIGRVRIITGNAALGAGIVDQNGNPFDLVVMDDFLYSEPLARVPEPTNWAMMIAGFALLGWRTRRRVAFA
jgi:hypothetical protein